MRVAIIIAVVVVIIIIIIIIIIYSTLAGWVATPVDICCVGLLYM